MGPASIGGLRGRWIGGEAREKFTTDPSERCRSLGVAAPLQTRKKKKKKFDMFRGLAKRIVEAIQIGPLSVAYIPAGYPAAGSVAQLRRSQYYFGLDGTPFAFHIFA